MIAQITLSEEMVKRIDDAAKSIGVSRSSFCATLLGQGMNAWDKSVELSNEVATKLLNDLVSNSVKG